MRFVAIGLVAGVFSALFGVGGGIVAVPLLIVVARLPERRRPRRRSLQSGSPLWRESSSFGVRGEVDLGYAALVGLPAAAGALAGTSLQQRIATSTLTYGFAALLAAVGCWLLVS